ncbi:MAG: transcription termination/antitermination protein NusA [Candidatus Nealsonbacteria bacterium]|nr:transcription termination/antitermination protein NusA [Candidatus Nealsonbacteria bacterium]
MEDVKNFLSAISQIAEEKGIAKEKIIEIIEQAYAAAYKKDYGEKGQIIKAKFDLESGKVKFWQQKLAVDESTIYSEEELAALKEGEPPVEGEARFEKRRPDGPSGREEAEDGEKKVRFNTEKHIMIDEAKKLDSKIKVGESLEIPLEAKEDYGRIAAQTAKQVILQRVREAEREIVLEEYKNKEEGIISGIVQRVEPRAVYLDIGKILAILPREEQVPGEFYRSGQRLKVFLLKVEETPKGPIVFVSRSYPKFVSKLFELEVPEVAAGTVVIRSIAREAGSRTKIAVSSNVEGVDPIGSMVGQKGTRVMAVINELGGEKIDIIEWADDPEKYIANSLSPAKALEVRIMPKNTALAIVPQDQLSLAIGKEGQNVRLAAKLTGWKIDVRSPEEAGNQAIEEKSEEEEVKKEKESPPKAKVLRRAGKNTKKTAAAKTNKK